jgi:hypothetical protein
MKLYLITHEDDGESFDLMAIANNADEAEAVWRDYYDAKGPPTFIFHVAAASPVGYQEGPKALEWGGVNLPRVGGRLTI